MTQREDLASRIEGLEARVETLVRRLDTLEGVRDGFAAAAPLEVEPAEVAKAAGDTLDDPEDQPSAWQGFAIRAGRTFLILAGAFLLRALTEADTLSEVLGIGLGLTWAALWGLMAELAGRDGRKVDASFHGVAAILVAFPIVWEGSTRFSVLGPFLGSALLAAFALAILFVTWRRGLRTLAFLAAMTAAVTSVSLVIAVRSASPIVLVLLPLGAASLAVAWHREWDELAWPAALALNVVIGLLAIRFGVQAYDWVSSSELLAFQAGLASLYLSAFAYRILVQRHSVGVFEVVQSLAVVAVGFEGAVAVAGAEMPGRLVLAALAGLVAIAAHSAAFLRLENREDRRLNVACCTALGSLLAVEALRLALPLPLAGVLWTVLALILAFAAVRSDRVALRIQVAILVLASALATGLLTQSLQSLVGKETPDGPPQLAALASLFLASVSLWVLRRHLAPDGRCWAWTAPCFILSLVVGVGIAGTVVGILAGPLAGFGESADHGALAVLRTGVLGILALGLASLGRRRERAEFRWATFLALGLAAVKVLLEDIPRGRPLTLFLTLALFGGALIGASRIVRRKASARPAVTNP